MKILSLLTLLSLFVNSSAESQWIEQTSPTTKPLYSVSVVDNSVAWACGRAGTIIRTTDGGADWTIISPGYFQDYQHFWSIFALDAQTALAAYSQLGGIGDITEVYKTTNGGSSWNLVFEQTGGWVMDLEMFTANNGFLYTSPLNGYWRFFNTTNGGASWQLIDEYQQSIIFEQGHWNSSFFSGTDIWFGSNSTNIYHSADNGYTWSHIPVTTQNIYSVWFNTANWGLLAGDNHLERTTDGGNTWGQTTGQPSIDSSSSIFGTETRWWVANQNHIYYSDDNLIFWNTQYSAPSGRYMEITGARSGNLIIGVRNNGGISAYMYPVPVELSSFTASASDDNVMINWKTATETNNKGFVLQRSKIIINDDRYDKTRYTEIAFVQGNGTSTNENNYNYIDNNLTEGIYSYRLIQIDFDGTQNKIGEVVVNVENKIKDFSLSQNYPNPFNPSTKIEYSIPQDGFVSLKIYNAEGEEIKQLVNAVKPAGSYSVNFNASNFPSGIYFYRLETGDYTSVKKMVLMK